jgi:ZIP family zinc transporter
LPAVFLKGLKAQHEDAMLGMAAGMMLAAAAFSLLLPGIEAGTQLTGHAFSGAGLVVLGMSLGVMLMLGLDAFTPHEHDKTGPCGPGHERCQRVWLFVMAVAIHNLPEGMAVGVGFAQGDLSVGLPLATAIALQDIPEGLAAGAMLFVVSHEVIPETHRNGHQTTATLGLMAGFALMMVLDTSLG